jgi:hypothetical protein
MDCQKFVTDDGKLSSSGSKSEARDVAHHIRTASGSDRPKAQGVCLGPRGFGNRVSCSSADTIIGAVKLNLSLRPVATASGSDVECNDNREFLVQANDYQPSILCHTALRR